MTAKTLTLRLLRALGLGAVFVTAVTVAPILHLDLPAGRLALALALEKTLNATFHGSFEIGAIDRVNVSGLVAREVRVKDPEGKEVLTISRLRAQADLPVLVETALFGGDPSALVVDHVHIDRAEAVLRPDPKTQVPSLARAFALRPSAPKEPGAPPGRRLRVAVQAIELTRGYARGSVLGLSTFEADLGGVRGSVRTTDAGADVTVYPFGAIVRGLRGADLKGVASFRLRGPGWLRATFDGHFGDVQLGTMVRLDGDQFMVALDAPKASPAAVRALLPEYPLLDDATVELEASGKLPRLMLQGRVQAGDARLLARGPVRLDEQLGAELEVEGKKVDLRLAIPKAPATGLDLLARVRVLGAERPPVVSFDATTEATVIEGLELPRADLSATFRAGALDGHALLHEPGLPARARFRVEPDGRAHVHAEAARVRIERAPRLAKALAATGSADIAVDMDIQDGAVRGGVSATVSALRAGQVRLERGVLSGRFQGAVANLGGLALDGSLAGSGLALGETPFERVGVQITGPLRQPRLRASLTGRDAPDVRAEASVAPRGGGVRVSGLAVAVRRDEAELKGRAASIEVGKDGVDVRDLDLAGLGGTLRGSAHVSPNLFALQAEGRALNLAALSRLLGLSTRPRGVVDLDADIEVARDVQRGSARLSLQDAAIGAIDGLSATAVAELSRGRLEATVRAELAAIGVLEGSLRTELGGSALAAESYRDMVGEAELSIAQADLGVLGTALAAHGALDGLKGKATARAKLTRSDPKALPNVELSGFTQGVEVALPADANDAARAAKVVSGMDALFSGALDGKTGDVALNAQLVDPRGPLALASLSGTVDLAEARRSPERLEAQLTHTPVLGKLLISERALTELPAVLQPPGVRGFVRAEAALQGTLAAPEITGRLSVGSFGLAAARNQRPIDLCAAISWEPVISRLTSSGEAFLSTPENERCSGSRVLRYSATGTVGRNAQGLVPRGTATLGLEGFPLDAVPGLGDADVSGRAFGTVSLTDTDGTPQLGASLELREAQVQGVAIGEGKLRVQSDVRSLGATLSLSHGGGELRASALAALDRRRAIPELDTQQPMFFRVTAKHVGAVVLSPFVKDVLSEIGGQVDADLSATLVAQGSPENPDKLAGSIQGYAALSEGNVQLAGLGLRLTDVSLKARAESVGSLTRISIDALEGRGGRSTDRVRLTDGKLWLDGIRVVRAEGNLVPEELPLMIEGVPQATASSRQPIPFRLERRADQMYVVVNIPYLNVALPQSSGRNVISLDENDSIEVLQPLGEPIRRSGEGLPWLARIELGQNVRITRSDLDLPITGTAEVLLADKVGVTGDLELIPGGRVQVSDNFFVIESGEVHFNTGDPSNPNIRVTATWRAPDDTVVYLTVTGTLKEPRLADPVSNPPKSREEIYALLMGFDEGGAPSAAGAIVGAQQLLSPLFQNTVARKISLRANESEKAEQTYTTYTAAIPIGDNLWFEGSYHSATTTDSSQPENAVSGTVDWRFRPHWSLRTEVGTIGTGLDLVWQYRY